MKCSGKKLHYNSKAKAMTAIAKIHSKGKSAKRVYKCKNCNSWHITNQKKKIRRLKK